MLKCGVTVSYVRTCWVERESIFGENVLLMGAKSQNDGYQQERRRDIVLLLLGKCVDIEGCVDGKTPLQNHVAHICVISDSRRHLLITCFRNMKHFCCILSNCQVT